MANLQIRLFGSFDVRVAGEPVTGLGARHAEAVLIYLLLRRGVCTHDDLRRSVAGVGSVEDVSRAVGVIRLRLGTEGARLKAGSGRVTMNLHGADVDLYRFDDGAAAGTPEGDQAAVRAYVEPLLAAYAERWVAAERQRREEMLTAIIGRLTEQSSDPGDRIIHLSKLVEMRPAFDGGWIELMQTQAQNGRRVAALQTYADCERYFRQQGLPTPDGMRAIRNQLKVGTRVTPPGANGSSAHLADLGGALPLDSDYYLSREADAPAMEAVAARESVLLIRGPSQTGKSSLLARCMEAARQAGAHVILTDIATVPEEDLATMDGLCLHLAGSMADQLGITVDLKTEWKSQYGAGANLDRFVRRRVLGMDDDSPVLWAVDNLDRAFGRAYTDEFLSRLRLWHENRVLDSVPVWHRFCMALVCATELHLVIADLNRSPFNVGVHVDVGDLSQAEVAELNRRIGPAIDEVDVADCYRLLGGHPFLTARALADARLNGNCWSSARDHILAEGGLFADHLARLRGLIQKDSDLSRAVAAVDGDNPCEEGAFLRLRTAGVLAGANHDEARFRCGLYEYYLPRPT